MPPVVEAELSFSARLQLRERVLAWISRDVGLCDFLLPPEMTVSWKSEQRKAWTDAIIDTFLQSDGSKGKLARQRLLSYETAGSLRRSCIKLRSRTADHRDLVKTSVSLETLWDGVSAELNDATWARCSLLFDTALISLRVAYLWMYMKAETSSSDVSFDTKKALFDALIGNYFNSAAPTDDQQDKHSDNFRRLLDAWRTELLKYTESEDFDMKMEALEKSQSLDETAACIEKFLTKANVDQSWILKMKKVDEEMEQGLWTRHKGTGRKQRKHSPLPEPEIPESTSSFEPKDADSDFDVKDVEVPDDDEDNSADDDENEKDLMRERMDMRTTRRLRSIKHPMRTTRQGLVGVAKYDKTMRPASRTNRTREPREEKRLDMPMNDRGAIARERQTPRSERTPRARSSVFDDDDGEHPSVETPSNGFQPQHIARKRKFEPDLDDEGQPTGVVQNETAYASPDVTRTPERKLGIKERAIRRGGAVAPRTRAQLQRQESTQLSGQVRRATGRGVVQGEEADATENRVLNGQSNVLGSISEAVVGDEIPPEMDEREEILITEGTSSKSSRPVVRDTDDMDSRDLRRQRVLDAFSQREEGQLESPSRPVLRRSTRTNPSSH